MNNEQEMRKNDDQCERDVDQATTATIDGSVEEPRTEESRRENPRPGEVYRHYKGDSYLILFLAKETSGEREGKINVVYENYEGEIFTRPLEEFLGYANKEEEIVERFSKEIGVTWSL